MLLFVGCFLVLLRSFADVICGFLFYHKKTKKYVHEYFYSPSFRHVNNSFILLFITFNVDSGAFFVADITFEISLGCFETINCLLRMKS